MPSASYLLPSASCSPSSSGVFGSLSAFWCYVIGFVACEYIKQDGIDSAQAILVETRRDSLILDLIEMFFIPFTDHWFMTIDQVDDRPQYFLSAMMATYGFWVIGQSAHGCSVC
jgi:hypothetical protein